MSSFADASTMSPVFDEDGAMVSQGFDAGGSSDRILVRASYTYSGLTPLVGPLLLGETNSRMFISTIVLQSEPYDFGAELAMEGEI